MAKRNDGRSGMRGRERERERDWKGAGGHGGGGAGGGGGEARDGQAPMAWIRVAPPLT